MHTPLTTIFEKSQNASRRSTCLATQQCTEKNPNSTWNEYFREERCSSSHPQGCGEPAHTTIRRKRGLGKITIVPRKSDNVVDDPAGKSGAVNEILKDNESWETEAAHPKNTAQEGKDTEKDITSTIAGLTVQPSAKTRSTVPEWRRNNEKPFCPKSLFSQSGSLFPRGENQNDRPFRCKKSVMSCTYQQTTDQPRMVEARPEDYRPFFKHEFVLGTILRGIIHEQDIMGTADPAMSQAPTQCTYANKLDRPPIAPPNAANRHVVHGEWGPISLEIDSSSSCTIDQGITTTPYPCTHTRVTVSLRSVSRMSMCRLRMAVTLATCNNNLNIAPSQLS